MFRKQEPIREFTVRKVDGTKNEWEYVDPKGVTKDRGDFQAMMARAEAAKALDELINPS